MKQHGIVVDNYRDQLVHILSLTILCSMAWPLGLAMITAAPSARNFAALPTPKSSRSVPFELMHRCLGHASKHAIFTLCKAHNIRITPGSAEEFHCRACHLAKAEAFISHTPAPPAQRLLAYVHWDFIPVQPPGLDGEKYLLHGVDAWSGGHSATPLTLSYAGLRVCKPIAAA